MGKCIHTNLKGYLTSFYIYILEVWSTFEEMDPKTKLTYETNLLCLLSTKIFRSSIMQRERFAPRYQSNYLC